MKSKKQKREEAEARDTVYKRMSIEQKAANIKHRRGESKREMDKLTKEKNNASSE